MSCCYSKHKTKDSYRITQPPCVSFLGKILDSKERKDALLQRQFSSWSEEQLKSIFNKAKKAKPFLHLCHNPDLLVLCLKSVKEKQNVLMQTNNRCVIYLDTITFFNKFTTDLPVYNYNSLSLVLFSHTGYKPMQSALAHFSGFTPKKSCMHSI